jgi:hypothetical protein
MPSPAAATAPTGEGNFDRSRVGLAQPLREIVTSVGAEMLFSRSISVDWKYKRFRQEVTFPAPASIVAAAARTLAPQSLGTGTLVDTADGFEADGCAGYHDLVATVHFNPLPDGTKVTVEARVLRYNGFGNYMLLDLGYFDRRIRRYFEAIRDDVHERLCLTDAKAAARVSTVKVAPAGFAKIFRAFLLIWVIALFVSALTGLFTGKLWLLGTDTAGAVSAQGARLFSAMLLLSAILVVVAVRRRRAFGRSRRN